MKIALVHDWLVTNSGAEKVLRAIVELYPDADIFSLVDFLNEQEREDVILGKFATTTFIQNLPFSKKMFRNYLPFFPLAIESLNLEKYDLIISSSWAVAKGIKKESHQTHICYCHTPIRYAWDLYDEYTKELPFLKKILVRLSLKYIRNWDLKTAKRVDYFVANSHFVKERIERTYKRDAEVIYPPVDLKNFNLQKEKKEFYITACRLVPYKKTKLIVEAFNEMPEKELLVIGSGDELESIRAIAKDNVSVLGYQSSEFLIKKMKEAKCFVYAALEDFGIVVVEALACGTPVVALADGGTKESVIDSINGKHFKTQTKEDIKDAIKSFEKLQLNPIEIRKTAENFDGFNKKFKAFVEEKIG